MNINDIPLPPPANKSNPRLKEQFECDPISMKYIEEDRHISVVPRMPPHSTRRHVNYKLPVGVLQKPISSQNVFESVNNHRRELFLPPTMNINSTVTKTFSKLVQSKINYVNEATVQIHRSRGRRDKSSERRTNRKRLRSKDSEHSPKKKNVKHDKRYCETKPPIKRPPLVMRSQVVVKKPLVSAKHEKSSRLERNSWATENHKSILDRQDRTIKKSVVLSLTSSSSGSSSSNSSSHSSVNVDLPLVSPKSPDEDFDTAEPDCVNQTSVTTKMANDYLKQLSATLVQMNMAYQSVYSKIPNKTVNESNLIDLSSIPLPLEQPLKPDVSPHHFVGPKTPELSCDPCESKLPIDQVLDNDNQCSLERPGAPSRQCSNSIDLGNFFPDSNSSFGSKNLKSPQCSMNVSSHSKDSIEHSEMKLRPLVPKISSFSIDYSQLDDSFSRELFLSSCHRKIFFDMKCCCTIPNPDDWGEGFRSCGNGQHCILAQLQIECDSRHCPTEYLCCNTQFTDLEHSLRKMHNIEFFFDMHQPVPWKIRAKKPIQKTRLVFEIGGVAEPCPMYISPNKDQTSIFVSQHVRISARRDVHSFLYYVNHGRADQENVRVEKWIVQGTVRVGLFATRDLQVGEELFLTYPTNHRLDVFALEPSSINDESDVLPCLRFLLHEPVSHKQLLVVMGNLILSNSNPVILDYFCNMGGPAVLCQLCDSFYEKNNSLSVDLFEKLVDLLVLVPFRFQKHVTVLGISLLRFVETLICRLGPQLPLSEPHVEKLYVISDLLSVAAMETKNNSSPSYGAKADQSQSHRAAAVSSNADILHCRLPPYWRSKECVHNYELRVFFYHRVTKAMQWEMPVYPWEANDDNDMEIYDYNEASRIQVSHDEIQQMYVGLNRIYEIKQKKMQTKGGGGLAKRRKDQKDLQKKEVFKKRIMAFIVNLLKPYRLTSCKEGKIESEEDMIYLTNKLSQTILYKELKLLHDKPEHLEVTAQVEVKTKIYVKAYMQSRGIIYKRPAHYSLSGAQQRNGTREPNAFS